MRIASWNINGMRARLTYLQHWLRDRAPDVVGLQELKMTDEQFPHQEFREMGYECLTHGQKAWNGVAILSRLPMEHVASGLPGQEDMGARLITARISTAEMGPLMFTTVYCPNGKNRQHPDFERKLAWFDALAEHLKKSHALGDEAAVIGGDFNICPSPQDTWNEDGMAGEIFHTDDERQRFRRLLDHGLVDLFRDRHPEAKEYSWWDYRGGAFHKKQGLRIDFLLASKTVLQRVEDVSIDRDYRKKKQGLTASDHAPVMADIA